LKVLTRKLIKQIAHQPFIRDGFALCGLDPTSADQSAFERHLESLGEDGIYAALNAENARINLG
jgi:hypothetical protein